MVESVSTVNQNYNNSPVQRIGTTPEGRGVYKLTEVNGDSVGVVSVAPNDCDKFERSFNQIAENAPKMQKYMEENGPEKLEKNRKTARWISGGGAFLGGMVPAIALKSDNWKKTLLNIGITIAGTFAGFLAGSLIAAKTTTPPGAIEVGNATQTLKTLDIQPLEIEQ